MHIFLLFFSWPLGFVWGNLVASAITTVIVMLRLHAQRKLHVAHHKELKNLHIAHHKEQLAAVAQMTGNVNPAILEDGGDLW